MAEEIHVGDFGTELIARIRDSGGIVDLNDYTVHTYRFLKPGAASFDVTPEFDTDGTDGLLVYTTPEDFFDTAGPWRWQVILTSPSGGWSTDIRQFTVHSNL